MQYLKKHLKIALAGAALISVPAWAFIGNIDEQVDCVVVRQGNVGQTQSCHMTGSITGSFEDYTARFGFGQVAGIGNIQVAINIKDTAYGQTDRYTLNGRAATGHYRTQSGQIVNDTNAYYLCVVPQAGGAEFCFNMPY